MKGLKMHCYMNFTFKMSLHMRKFRKCLNKENPVDSRLCMCQLDLKVKILD